MRFIIESKYNTHETVYTKANEPLYVCSVSMDRIGRLIKIEYLCEYESGERRWFNEDDLSDKEEYYVYSKQENSQ